MALPVLVVLSLAACSADVSTPPPARTEIPTAGPTPSPDLSVLPVYTLLAGGEAIDGVLAGYCWTWDITDDSVRVLCTPPRLPDFDWTIPLPAGEPITIIGDPPPAEWLTLSLQQGELQMVAATQRILTPPLEVEWTPDVPPGDYVLVVHAEWPRQRSDVIYHFPLTIGEPEATETP